MTEIHRSKLIIKFMMDAILHRMSYVMYNYYATVFTPGLTAVRRRNRIYKYDVVCEFSVFVRAVVSWQLRSRHFLFLILLRSYEQASTTLFIKFQIIKVALNPFGKIVLNFAKSCNIIAASSR